LARASALLLMQAGQKHEPIYPSRQNRSVVLVAHKPWSPSNSICAAPTSKSLPLRAGYRASVPLAQTSALAYAGTASLRGADA